MGLTSALLQSYFVRYPLNPSSTFALPNTSRKPLLKHNHKAPCRLVTAGKSYHITSHMLVRKGRHASQLPASLCWCCTDMFLLLLLLLLLLLRMMMHCIALHCIVRKPQQDGNKMHQEAHGHWLLSAALWQSPARHMQHTDME